MTPERIAFLRDIVAERAATHGKGWTGPHGESLLQAADAIRELCAHLDTLTAERDELAATIANERGEGEPPGEGWAYVRYVDGYLWRHAHGTVERQGESWAWRCYLPESRDITGQADTAREGMRVCMAERARLDALEVPRAD